MKILLLASLICCLFLTSNAQTIKPYKAILETESGKLKGILQKVDSTNVILNIDGRFTAIKISDIQLVKIRTIKKHYKTQDFLNDMPQTEYKVDQKGEMVDHWGNKAPGLKDEAAAATFGVILNGLFNVIAFPIHAVNPNIARFDLKDKKKSKQLSQLVYYSINYQSSPNTHLADLKKLKEVSEKLK
ncbi:hypothetical protein ABIE26_001949 [Pedobacter africanus]|uniref:Uncharacterized protein n=1 Tax=Pedobacter africanus TaxID=151894 RepID=A0ACC6KR03_9SPHI|nr:hypothetical protein [Pedobacter africanus]MDR6781563.1 hypothetical protein [Pedobacter africanus]